MIKKILSVIVLVLFLAGVYANGNAKDISMPEIEQQLQNHTAFNKMTKCDNRNLMQFFGLDYQQYDSYLYYKSSEALSVEEILIVKAKEKSDLSGVQDAVDTRIDSQISTFEGYGPTQVAQLKNAVVVTKGNYLFYCTGDDAEDLEEVFEDAVQ